MERQAKGSNWAGLGLTSAVALAFLGPLLLLPRLADPLRPAPMLSGAAAYTGGFRLAADDDEGFTCSSTGDGTLDSGYSCSSQGDGILDSCYLCSSTGDGTLDSCYVCSFTGDGVLDSCFLCSSTGNGTLDSCFLCAVEGNGIPDSCFICSSKGDGILDSCYQCDVDDDGILDNCFQCDSNNDGLLDSCMLCSLYGDGVLNVCYVCSSTGDGTLDSCYQCDGSGDGKLTSCFLCSSKDDGILDSCYSCDSSGSGFKDSCYLCDAQGTTLGVPTQCYLCDSGNYGILDSCYLCDTNNDGILDSCYLCDSDGDGTLDACYLCDSCNVGYATACYECDSNGDGKLDSCFLCDPTNVGYATACYECDANGDSIKDNCYLCDPGNVGYPTACFLCDADGDGIKDNCYLCDTDGDGTLDSCYQCDTNGDGIKDNCYLCDPGNVGYATACYLCDSGGDGIKNACYLCTTNGGDTLDTCLQCDANNSGTLNTCFLCDPGNVGYPTACFLCDSDGDGKLDSCYLCDNNGDGINDACYMCATGSDGIRNSCYICSTNSDGVPNTCAYLCASNGDGVLNGCYLCDSNGDGINNTCFSCAGAAVSASAGQFDPDPVAVGEPATSILSASATDPTSGCPLSAPTWSWEVTRVEYKAESYDDWLDDGYRPTIAGSSATATLTATFAKPGYWNITVKATATWTCTTCGCDCTQDGTATVEGTAVAIDKIIVNNSSPENVGPGFVVLGRSLTLLALPKPSDASFPDLQPIWTIPTKPAASTLASPTGGVSALETITPDVKGQYVMQATCGTSSAKFTLYAIEVKLKSVAFSGSGTDYTPLISDNGETTYSAPHWLDANTDGIPERTYPVTFTRNTTVSLYTVFTADPSPAGAKPMVEAYGPSVPLPLNVPPTAAIAGGSIITLPATPLGNPLPDTVNYYNTMNFGWYVSFNNGAPLTSPDWAYINLSQNVVYVTLNKPTCTTNYHTLFYIGCKNANGKNNAADVVSEIWGQPTDIINGEWETFMSLNVGRVEDATQMTYWKGWPVVQPVQTLPKMLSGNGDGSCYAWSQLFEQTLAAQGLGAQLSKVTAIDRTAFGIMVNNWRFIGSGSWPGTTYPYLFDKDVITQPDGIAAQGNPDPDLRAFDSHFVVKYGGSIYDPSYGKGPYLNPIDHQNAAVAGIFGRMAAGEFMGRYIGRPLNTNNILEVNYNP